MRSLAALPKAHLHLHLEGAIRPSTLVDIAARHGAPVPEGAREGRFVFADPAGGAGPSLAGFLANDQQVRSCLQAEIDRWLAEPGQT